MKAKSITASWHGRPSIVRAADHHRLAEPRRDFGLRKPLRVRPLVEEVERVVRAKIRRFLGEAVRIGQLFDPLGRMNREVVTAMRADAQIGVQLVVTIVRAALGTGVGVGLVPVRGRRKRMPVLDRHVDLLDHAMSLVL